MNQSNSIDFPGTYKLNQKPDSVDHKQTFRGWLSAFSLGISLITVGLLQQEVAINITLFTIGSTDNSIDKDGAYLAQAVWPLAGVLASLLFTLFFDSRKGINIHYYLAVVFLAFCGIYLGINKLSWPLLVISSVVINMAQALLITIVTTLSITWFPNSYRIDSTVFVFYCFVAGFLVPLNNIYTIGRWTALGLSVLVIVLLAVMGSIPKDKDGDLIVLDKVQTPKDSLKALFKSCEKLATCLAVGYLFYFVMSMQTILRQTQEFDFIKCMINLTLLGFGCIINLTVASRVLAYKIIITLGITTFIALLAASVPTSNYLDYGIIIIVGMEIPAMFELLTLITHPMQQTVASTIAYLIFELFNFGQLSWQQYQDDNEPLHIVQIVFAVFSLGVILKVSDKKRSKIRYVRDSSIQPLLNQNSRSQN